MSHYSQSVIVSHWVSLDTDHLSPFREFALSRAHFLNGVPGNSLSNRSGFFSLLVFRGITFCTPFIRDGGKVYYNDLNDWEEMMASIQAADKKKDKKYFCDRKAYGGTCLGLRSTSNAHKLWTAAGSWVLYQKAQKLTLPIPYEKAKKYFSKYNGELYSIGPLVKMLLLGASAIFFIPDFCSHLCR